MRNDSSIQIFLDTCRAASLLNHPEVRHSSGLGLQNGVAVDHLYFAGGVPVVHNGGGTAVHVTGIVCAVLLQDVNDIFIGGTDGTGLTAVGADENHRAVLPFNDDGTANSTVGSVPAGLTICGGKIVSDQYGNLVPEKGFAGFNTSDVLVVAQSMTASQATEQNIRDGCEFGPVLIINGEVNQGVYSGNSGYNPRTAKNSC